MSDDDLLWATGADALAALDDGEELWEVEAEDPEDGGGGGVSFDDAIAHDFSDAIDAVVDALNAARIPGVAGAGRSDREIIETELEDEDGDLDVEQVEVVVDRAMRAALASFGPARPE